MKRKTAFAARLISLMEERNLTVQDAANLAGVSLSTMQNWRSGHLPTNYHAIDNLAKALDTTLRYLLVGENDRPDK